MAGCGAARTPVEPLRTTQAAIDHGINLIDMAKREIDDILTRNIVDPVAPISWRRLTRRPNAPSPKPKFDPKAQSLRMSYHPQDHDPTARQVAAAWVVCLGIVGLALGMTAAHQGIATADPELVAGALDRCSTIRARIPRFAQCRTVAADASIGLAPAQRAAIVPPLDHCG